MPSRAFIVTLDLDVSDPSSDAGTAEELQESLNSDGFQVVSVSPWSTGASTMSSPTQVGSTPPPVTTPLW